jgi:hypothetical protein
MNRTNDILTGVLAGAILATLGFLVFRVDSPARAETGGDGGGGLVLATPSSQSADLGSNVYILKTNPPEEATLGVYKINQGKEIVFIAARRVCYDLKAYDYTTKGNGLSVAEAEKIIKEAEEERKKKEKK